ncbi:MAG: FecR domain-containing protein [Bacteroidales bacterium]|nr:FecR domain-containing protein [Bacteroidales bacterium]
MFRESHPALVDDMDQAVLMVQSIRFAEKTLPPEDVERLWQSIRKHSTNKRRHILRYVAACAASVALLAGAFRLLQEQADEPANHDAFREYAREYTMTSQDLTTGKEVQLVLADNSNLSIKTDQAHIQYDKEGKLIVNASNIVNQSANVSNGEITYNKIIVPWGKRASVVFNDGTKLWLNAGSRAVYPVEFTGREREVYVEGEAYFEVAKNENRPFIVKCNDLTVRVLGTKFNVTAYSDESQCTVTLVDGMVEVASKDNSAIHLLPNQSISIDRETSYQEVKNVHAYDYVCWTEGYLKFNSEYLSSILRKLERHYARAIEINPAVKDCLITGKLDMKENIADVLKVIEKVTPVQTEITPQQIIIHPKSQ